MPTKPTTAISTYIPASEFKRAVHRLSLKLSAAPEELSEDASIAEILVLAQEGDHDALMFLYRKSRQMIAHVFWKKFIGPNRKVIGPRLARGDDATFAAAAWDRLPNALVSFDPYKNTTNTLNSFHFWYGRYLTSMAINMNREYSEAGITGQSATRQIQQVDHPRDAATGAEIDSVDYSTPSHESSIDEKLSLESYLDALEREMHTNKKKALMYRVLKMKMDGYELPDIADALGVDMWKVRAAIKELRADMRAKQMYEAAASESFPLYESRNVPQWKAMTDSTEAEALRFRSRKLDAMITHHVSVCYLITETKTPNRPQPYFIVYYRLPVPRGVREEFEYSSYVDLLSTHRRNPGILNINMAKQLCRDHFKSLGTKAKSAVDPASPASWSINR